MCGGGGGVEPDSSTGLAEVVVGLNGNSVQSQSVRIYTTERKDLDVGVGRKWGAGVGERGTDSGGSPRDAMKR